MNLTKLLIPMVTFEQLLIYM